MTEKIQSNTPQARPPEGWDPARDNDAQWRGLELLLRDADEPEFPAPTRFEAMQMRTRRLLEAEGLLERSSRPAAATEEEPQHGFLPWLRNVLTGGGMGAQVLRFGLVGAATFAVAVRVGTGQPPQGAGGAPMGHASVTKGVVAPDYAAERTATPSMQVSVAMPTDATGAWRDTAPRQGWDFPSGVAATPPSTGPVNRSVLAEEALEQLQALKFDSLVAGDDARLAKVRGVEQTLSRLLQESSWEPSPRANALEHYRRGEQSMAAKRWVEAQQAFEEVIRTAPGSSQAFLAEFQIGRIAYEYTQDYDLALESFRHCLEQYPADFASEDHRDFLLDRVEILSQATADAHQSLKDWHAAQLARTNPQAVKLLLKVIERTPSPKLAAQAAGRLKDIMISDATYREVDHLPTLEALRARLGRGMSGAEGAELQFALAEITARRAQNLGQAMIEYRAALDMNPPEDLRRILRARINLLTNERLTGVMTNE